MLTPHQMAALNIDKHISLTANAGSGKTFVLSKRYLEIALKKNVSLRNIAAITFTDKAASELYKKIAKEIEDKIAETADPKLKRKLEILRRQLISANISTIHSFCIDVLRQFPVEAGIDANFTPIDEQTSNELAELSIEDIVNNHLSNGDEELKNLIRLFGSKAAFSRQIFSLIKNRKNVLICAENIYTADAADIANFFDSSYNQLVDTLLFDFEADLIDGIKRINENVLLTKPDNKNGLLIASLLSEYSKLTKPAERVVFLKQIMSIVCTTGGTIRKQGYFKDEFDRFANEILTVEKTFSFFKKFEVVDDTEKINFALAEFGKELLNFFYKTLSVYEKKKTENGFLDFEDILLLTQKIILSDEVRGYLTSQYKYIMIDEYQDTNELQYNIFLPILDGLKKNNLFVVGDEKQSIYMFRDAELEVFDRTKNDIKIASGDEQLISLPDSFRMSPAICLFTNTLFKKLFENPNLRFNEVAHSDLVCARNDDTFGGVELLILKKEKKDADEIELPEAELVAKKILQIKKQTDVRWNEIAILCRKRSPFADLEKTFVKYKIPFTIIGGKGFFQRQTISDIYNYFSFLLDQNNDTALVGILRSPFFTISDAEIYKLSLIDKKNYFERLKIRAGEDKKLKKICGYLSENILLSKNSDIPAVLRKILTETGYTAVVASRANGVQETANVEKLIKLTIQFNANGYKTLYDYVAYLKEAIGSQEDEAQAALSDESNSVNIMTVHQSKGMEYSYVFLYKCAEGAPQSLVKSKQVTVDKKFGLLTKLPLNNNYYTDYLSAPILFVTDYISKRKHLAELKRLFYVAATRAKDYLIISAEIKNTISETTFIGLLKEGLNIDFDAESYSLSGELNYLINDDGYINRSKTISLEIPVTKELLLETDDKS
ncbi:MAG: UvrD-helicase domain-containing protein, partial [Ignavibacteriaceae bacterium]|nr:UvrD-helicase domain-containing protein [Ignavibacteriaceae bacterium]